MSVYADRMMTGAFKHPSDCIYYSDRAEFHEQLDAERTKFLKDYVSKEVMKL